MFKQTALTCVIVLTVLSVLKMNVPKFFTAHIQRDQAAGGGPYALSPRTDHRSDPVVSVTVMGVHFRA